MPKKSGGLGNNIKSLETKDLLDTAFFGSNSKQAPKMPQENEDVKYKSKFFKIEEKLLKEVKLYGIEHELKEYEVISLALKEFFEKGKK